MRSARDIAREYLGEGPNAEALAASIEALVAYEVETAVGTLKSDLVLEKLLAEPVGPHWNSYDIGFFKTER